MGSGLSVKNILKLGVCGILEKIMSVHNNSTEDNSLFGSWDRCRPRTGGLRKGKSIEGGKNRNACKDKNIWRFRKVWLFCVDVSINGKRRLLPCKGCSLKGSASGN